MDDVIELSSDGSFETTSTSTKTKPKFNLEDLDYSLIKNNDSPTKTTTTTTTTNTNTFNTNILNNISVGEYKIYKNNDNTIDIIVRLSDNNEVPTSANIITKDNNNITSLEIKTNNKTYIIDIPGKGKSANTKICQCYKDYCITRITTNSWKF